MTDPRAKPGVEPGTPGTGGSSLGKWLGIGCGIPAALIIGFVLLATLWPKDDSPRPSDAIIACENAIEAQLKSPSTASFNSAVSGDGPFVVVGSVDAQNGFGATVRADYQCTVAGSRATIDYFE